MLTYYLLNSFMYGSHQRWAGELIDDRAEDVAALRAAGAILWSVGDAQVASAALIAGSLRRRGGSPEACSALVMAAAASTAGRSAGSGVFGNGESASVILDGTTTFNAFSSLSNGVYTLTSDVYIHELTVFSGVTLYSAGYKIFVDDILLNLGLIHNNGKAAANGTAGGTSPVGTLGIGMAGGNGRAANTGLAGSNQSNGLQDAACVGGPGGAGGANAGGNGGAYSANVVGNGGADFIIPTLTGFLPNQTSGGNQAIIGIIGGGAGGGGGGSDNAGVTGGGGGGGGGVLIVAAMEIINNGIISASGGNGANATGAGGNGGGGGGGAGGIIQASHRYYSGTGVWLANGGLPGAGLGPSGVAGTAGNVGHINRMTG